MMDGTDIEAQLQAQGRHTDHDRWVGVGEMIPPAPSEIEDLAERLIWRQGYRQALDDLLQIETHGGEITVNGETVHSRD